VRRERVAHLVDITHAAVPYLLYPW
jgi:hypothetical protein